MFSTFLISWEEIINLDIMCILRSTLIEKFNPFLFAVIFRPVFKSIQVPVIIHPNMYLFIITSPRFSHNSVSSYPMPKSIKATTKKKKQHKKTCKELQNTIVTIGRKNGNVRLAKFHYLLEFLTMITFSTWP